MDCAASTNPHGTCSIAVSTNRPTNGIAAIMSGTVAAAVPMEVPTMNG